jgi:succinyl-CoA synthetase beta subunit
MKIHEYQAKELLGRYGLPVPKGILVASAQDASRAAESLGGRVVVKSQVHAGGRGAGGGIKLATSPEEAAALYERLFGMLLVTKQTGPAGKRVHCIYMEEACSAAREFYLALVVDRSSGRVALLASGQGGGAIEETAGGDPEAVSKTIIDPVIGPATFAIRSVAVSLGLAGKTRSAFIDFVQRAYRMFVELDCDLLEINPLAETADGGLLALDCKLSFDDSALFRHPDILAYRDIEEEVPEELEAAKQGLSYVRLEGTIGCLVNGAGLALATLDAVSLRGGAPANFLDIGGSATEDAIRRAFVLLAEDGRAKVALVNVFGGIMSCETVARGVARAVEECGLGIPIVARLSGNRAEEGRRVLGGRVSRARFAVDLEEAATMAVAAAAGR